MCVGRSRPPKLPDPEPMDSAIEQTASKVVVGSKKKSSKDQKMTPITGRKRLGTQSLQIPLLPNTSSYGNLNYL